MSARSNGSMRRLNSLGMRRQENDSYQTWKPPASAPLTLPDLIGLAPPRPVLQ